MEGAVIRNIAMRPFNTTLSSILLFWGPVCVDLNRVIEVFK